MKYETSWKTPKNVRILFKKSLCQTGLCHNITTMDLDLIITHGSNILQLNIGSGQIIATKPPRSPQMMVIVRESLQNLRETFSFRNYKTIFPDVTDTTQIFPPQLFGQFSQKSVVFCSPFLSPKESPPRNLSPTLTPTFPALIDSRCFCALKVCTTTS